MIPIRTLAGDYFEFDEKNYRIVGRKTKRTYRLGDPVRVQVAKCNLERKQMDYELVE
jgi:ribonuclease R